MEWADLSNYLGNIIVPLIVGFFMGRVFQKWADGTMSAEDAAYQVGYEEGYTDGIHCRYDPRRQITCVPYWNQR